MVGGARGSSFGRSPEEAVAGGVEAPGDFGESRGTEAGTEAFVSVFLI